MLLKRNTDSLELEIHSMDSCITPTLKVYYVVCISLNQTLQVDSHLSGKNKGGNITLGSSLSYDI